MEIIVIDYNQVCNFTSIHSKMPSLALKFMWEI